MYLLLKKIFFLSTPFFIWTFIIVLIDPFNLFNISNLITNQEKLQAVNRLPSTMATHNMFWKLIEFKKKPVENVILGDSRPYLLKVKHIEKITKNNYYNFGIPGGSYKSIIDTFWYCNQLVKLKNVYIGVSFHRYNRYADYDLFSEPKSIIANPLLYFNNRKVVKSGVYLFCQKFITRKKHKKSLYKNKKKPTTKTQHVKSEGISTVEKKWQIYKCKGIYDKFDYPALFFNELKKISNYCHKNNVNLVFIIFPNHVDEQNYIIEMGLQDHQFRFKNDIKSLGFLFDFNYPNDITRNRNNFGDPYHAKQEVLDQIILEVWGNDPHPEEFWGNTQIKSP